MQPKIIISIAGIVFVSIVLIFSLTRAVHNQNWPAKLASSTISEAPQNLIKPKSGLPIRLRIPTINVDAVLDSVGVTPGGAMDVPKGPTNAAWFDLGPRPGDAGSAVISGHYGWKDNIPAVFDNLHLLQKGDKLSVEDEEGVINMFVVRELRTYDQNDDASNVFGSSDGKAHLNLITCQGVWNKAQKSYADRLVVFTDFSSP